MAMTYLRLPASLEGTNDPTHTARLAFGDARWRSRHRAAQLLDIAGRWQALHYLITGDPWEGRRPGSDVVCGGPLLTQDQAMSEELAMDVIYLAPDRVKAAAEHLAGAPFGALASRFDCARMAELKIESADAWLKRPAGDVRDELRMAYEHLVDFFGAAAATNQAIYKSMAAAG
jgi:hypothetical protein